MPENLIETSLLSGIHTILSQKVTSPELQDIITYIFFLLRFLRSTIELMIELASEKVVQKG